ncbi:hypothetical protein MATL_G00240880 [Megalops atlanticus]|uniref:L27 domain-containing protein n=1 Tax=Megalops atlanticus TaxID=7932 RepID=A0A9D3PES7_MEGAT|nr:hypothetical protein MATL_G00240880 [Megalops atlanticus]
MPVRKKDAQRALILLEEYRTKLNQTEDRQLRHSIERVIDIFQSNLFQALIDIQEFYEVTLLDNQKCGESPKPAEPAPPVNLWDLSSLPSTTVTSQTLPSSLSTSIEESPLLNEILHVLGKSLSSEAAQVSTALSGGGASPIAACLAISSPSASWCGAPCRAGGPPASGGFGSLAGSHVISGSIHPRLAGVPLSVAQLPSVPVSAGSGVPAPTA